MLVIWMFCFLLCLNCPTAAIAFWFASSNIFFGNINLTALRKSAAFKVHLLLKWHNCPASLAISCRKWSAIKLFKEWAALFDNCKPLPPGTIRRMYFKNVDVFRLRFRRFDIFPIGFDVIGQGQHSCPSSKRIFIFVKPILKFNKQNC